MMLNKYFLNTVFEEYLPKIFTTFLFKFQMKLLYLFVLLMAATVVNAKPYEPLIYMRPNETPMFTELYQRYGLLVPPAVHVYDSSIYIGQPGENKLLTPSSVAFFKDVEETLRAYHTRIGNIGLFRDLQETKYVFCPSNGSLQIIFALVYAIAQSEPQKHFLFVEKIPYYSFHEHAVNFRPYPNARFQGFQDPSEVKPKPDETLVEFVTSPNNPDGTFRRPYTSAKIIIADFVFASPSYGSDGSGYIKRNLEWLSKARNEGKHVLAFNSVSKALGKPGYRLGYMWFPVNDSYANSIFHNFFAYTWKLTVGDSTSGVADALNLVSALLARTDAGQALRDDAYHTIVTRHQLLKKELVKRYPGTEVTSIEGSPTLFAKLHRSDNTKTPALKILLKDLNASVDNGTSMGATDDFVRINLCGYSGDMAEFLNRLANAKKYKAEDLLISSAHHCTHTTIHSSENGQYVVNPDDCNIDVDAKDANVQIILPSFINYQHSNLMTIKKIDSSNHSIHIDTNKFTVALKKTDEVLHTQWTQPFFLNGQWEIVHPKKD
jgi:aspartate/methionine/tyrosine aminotransferase